MKRYRVRLVERAEADVAEIYRFVRRKSASTSVARNYIARVRAFLAEFETFPERGTVRANVREGLRIVGFERVWPSSSRTAKSSFCGFFMRDKNSRTAMSDRDGRPGYVKRSHSSSNSNRHTAHRGNSRR
jgi:toxin ParE1/3/4